jgi:hypothetical protein
MLLSFMLRFKVSYYCLEEDSFYLGTGSFFFFTRTKKFIDANFFMHEDDWGVIIVKLQLTVRYWMRRYEEWISVDVVRSYVGKLPSGMVEDVAVVLDKAWLVLVLVFLLHDDWDFKPILVTYVKEWPIVLHHSHLLIRYLQEWFTKFFLIANSFFDLNCVVFDSGY